MDNDVKICDECGSEFLAGSSKMISLCPECASILYGYENCKHIFEQGRCVKCLWNGNKSEYVKKIGGMNMYLKLHDYEYKITSANVGFDIAEDNKSLIMFIDIDGIYEAEDLDYELRTIRLYHNNGFNTGVKEPQKLIGKTFEWNGVSNNKGEEAGTLYVLEHEDVTLGKIDILDVTQDLIKIKWHGQANVFWNDIFDENVPFEAEIEVKVPSVPKVKVINGFKKTKLKIDKNTEIELLNFSDMVTEAERCKELYLKNDLNAWSTFDKALKLKLTYMKKEYYGEAVYQGSGTKCYMVFDEESPLNVQITKTSIWIANEEYKFYILVETKK